MNKKEIVLTGDRTTGPLHLGHYVGSLQNRIDLQEKHDQYIMLADIQALTDNFEHPEQIKKNAYNMVLDYLSIGIDPQKSTIFLQSLIPEIAELAILYLNFVTINRLKRNPTVKTEMQQKQFGKNVTAGFLMYPVHQAADITIVKGTLVPVGNDQLPMIEQTNEIVRSFNHTYQADIFPHVNAVISNAARLSGTDGKAKMGKSLGNAIFLSDDPDTVSKKVMSMYTDPKHIHINDPGTVEGNTVFTYLDIFDPDKEAVSELKAHYRRGGLGDVTIKKRLIEKLNDFLNPIRNKRSEYAHDMDVVKKIIMDGTATVKEIAHNTMSEVRRVMHIDY